MLRAGLDNLAAYPAPPHAAEAALAHYHGVPPECVRLLAGASEGFALLPALAGARPVVTHPGFSEPEDQLLAAGQEVTAVVAQPPFTHHAIPDEASLVVLGNPCNPTGMVTSFDNYLGEHLLVVDEAFMDVVGEEHSAAHRARLPKTQRIQGLRVNINNPRGHRPQRGGKRRPRQHQRQRIHRLSNKKNHHRGKPGSRQRYCLSFILIYFTTKC